MLDKKDNYLENAEMSVEDNYNCIDGIINNTTPKDEYSEKISKYLESIKKDEEKKKELSKYPLSAKTIKNNAVIISNSSSRQPNRSEQEKSL
ncbi:MULTISPECIES: DUF4316 domain-containing protein [unclassified Ruminococcus]|uniref:DUF4316 domain-containing protein n=1 Tax=unclassified Ruminococcus TaxID=2608920 RepID=UPI00210DE848|nr:MULTISPECIES: DUF4316 domain-containing protein [unclassified Ruminococcus]MCQ4021732.1 DUF4316 domain-containing protein [Ruminococcus sp. zg-924]MCQ4114176.1 DUF4316 domain-containing protein [Ruminococcus sp. zg-921]